MGSSPGKESDPRRTPSKPGQQQPSRQVSISSKYSRQSQRADLNKVGSGGLAAGEVEIASDPNSHFDQSMEEEVDSPDQTAEHINREMEPPKTAYAKDIGKTPFGNKLMLPGIGTNDIRNRTLGQF